MAVGVPVISQVLLSITRPVGREGDTEQDEGTPPVRLESPFAPMEVSFVSRSTFALAFPALSYVNAVGAATIARLMVSFTLPAILVAVIIYKAAAATPEGIPVIAQVVELRLKLPGNAGFEVQAVGAPPPATNEGVMEADATEEIT